MTAQELLQSPTRYKLTVADYLTLDRSGAFDGLRTELIEGEIVVLSPQHRRHARIKMAIYNALRDALHHLDTGLTPLVEASMEANSRSLLEPDVLLTNEPDGEGFVPLKSVALVVEVADSTLKHDLTTKSVGYAKLGVSEYWVVDVQKSVIHRMWTPEGGLYAEKDRVKFGETLSAETIAGLSIDTGTLR